MGNDRDYVIIIGASEMVFPAYRIAREDLGLGIIGFDYASDAVGMRYADVPVKVSTKDVSGAVKAARELAHRYRIRGVFTCGADVEVTVAAVAEALKLPGIPLDVAMDCNDKIRMHERLDRVGFTQKARYRIVEHEQDLTDAINYTGLPCVVKPVANCASRGVQRLDQGYDVTDAFTWAQANNLGDDRRVLVEQALDGSKHTVEMIAYQAEWHLLSIIDTYYISPRWPCETGLNTTTLSKKRQTAAFEFAKKVAALVGVGFGAHKVDINFDRHGNLGLIELTARLSGGFHCQYASPLAYGSNDIRAALKLAIGLPLDFEDICHKWQRGSAVRAVFPEPGRIVRIGGVEEARRMQGVAEVFVWRKPGDVVRPYRNSADRVAFVIAEGATTDDAIVNAERAGAIVSIETVPVAEIT